MKASEAKRVLMIRAWIRWVGFGDLESRHWSSSFAKGDELVKDRSPVRFVICLSNPFFAIP